MELTDQNTIILSNRSGKDRRTRSSFNIRSLLLGGRREKIRRQEDTTRIFYVDHFSPELFFAIVCILFLCALDALLTLHLLHHGAYEVNPVMAFFLQFGPYTFFVSKYLFVIMAVFCLLMFRNVVVRMIKVSTRTVLHIVAVCYILVVAWELYLISNVPYKPDYKLLPGALKGPISICRVYAPDHPLILDQKIRL
jgi:hypothetical protein